MQFSNDDPELTRGERDALVSLSATDVPPEGLENQVVVRLRSLGLIRRSAWKIRAFGIMAFIATAIAMFGIGRDVGTQRAVMADTRTPGAEFLLLLYEGADFDPGAPEQASARIQEYRTWATHLADIGHLISAGRLSAPSDAIRVPSTTIRLPSTGEPTGYFLVVALDRNEAVRLAATCPHVRHGGIVVIRPIV
jgi:hypothetical protein